MYLVLMIANYYLDESSHTGDLTLIVPDFTFGEQYFFVLSCFGVADEAVQQPASAKR